MQHIKFRYRDAMSNWEWREQECTVSNLNECIKLYGLGIDCQYEIISIEDLPGGFSYNGSSKYNNQKS